MAVEVTPAEIAQIARPAGQRGQDGVSAGWHLVFRRQMVGDHHRHRAIPDTFVVGRTVIPGRRPALDRGLGQHQYDLDTGAVRCLHRPDRCRPFYMRVTPATKRETRYMLNWLAPSCPPNRSAPRRSLRRHRRGRRITYSASAIYRAASSHPGPCQRHVCRSGR